MRLEKCGFVRVGRIAINPEFQINFKRRDAEWWVCCVYALKVGNEVLRIGKSERYCLSVRIDRWNRDVNLGLQGLRRTGGTPPEEAAEWKKALKKTKGEFWAKRITPPNKKRLRAEERKLIGDFCPRLNHDLPKKCQPK